MKALIVLSGTQRTYWKVPFVSPSSTCCTAALMLAVRVYWYYRFRLLLLYF